MDSSDGDSNKRVVVAVRIRPKLENVTNATQVAERYHPEAASRINDTTVRLSETKGKETKTNVFSFDYVFDRDSTQQEVYEDTTLGAVDAALQGCNATVMTYGQTGSGKTWTVLGSVRSNPLSDDVLTQDTGLFLRVLKDILLYGEARAAEVHTVLCLSVVEIYLDSVRDLLSRTPTESIDMRIDGENVHMPDLTFAPITQLRDAINAYKVATGRRVSRATEANDQSSRSHALFSIDIYQQRRTASNPEPLSCEALTELRVRQTAAQQQQRRRDAASPASPQSDGGCGGGGTNPPIICPGMPNITYSRIVLTDLAGSEKMKHSNAKGEGFEEMKKINSSLTSLGNVVHSLYSGAKHIPYRDSKLTLLLRSSFAAPNAHVVLIANMAPTSLTFDETLSTLFFANKVKAMKVATASAADMTVESSFLVSLRSLEELGSELRVLRETTEYVPQIRRQLPDAAFNRPLQMLCPTAAGDAKRRERLLRDSIIAPLLEEGRTAAEAKRREKSAAQSVTSSAIVKEVLEQHDRVVARQHEALQKMQKDMQTDQEDAASFARERDTALALEGQRAAVVEAELAQLTQRRAQLPIHIEDLNGRLAALTAQYEALEQRFMNEHSADEAAWREFLRRCEAADAFFDANAATVSRCREVWQMRLQYLTLCLEVLHSATAGRALEVEVDRVEATEWIRRAVVVMGNNAVTLSLRAAAKARAPRARPAPPSARPPGKGAAGDATPASPASPGPTSIPRAPPAPRPKAPPRAVSLYDQPDLLTDIEGYIMGGTMMLKHGRSGAPHYRFFYVLVGDASCRLCWDRDEADRHDGSGSSIDLARVSKVVMGQSSEVFQRSRTRDGLLTSFSIHYVKKQQCRTLDIVCDTEAEFEAWLTGLCRIIGTNPAFEERMPLPEEDEQVRALSAAEKELCSSWHIPPRTLRNAVLKVDTVAQRRRVEQPKITPGDLRFISQLDIFRASALWEHLQKLGRVQPPNPATMRNYLRITEM